MRMKSTANDLKGLFKNNCKRYFRSRKFDRLLLTFTQAVFFPLTSLPTMFLTHTKYFIHPLKLTIRNSSNYSNSHIITYSSTVSLSTKTPSSCVQLQYGISLAVLKEFLRRREKLRSTFSSNLLSHALPIFCSMFKGHQDWKAKVFYL